MLAVWRYDAIPCFSEHLASSEGARTFRPVDDAIFRKQFLNQLITSLVSHVREIAPYNSFVPICAHGGFSPFKGAQ
jgi:hypothetical protein